jgi:hypothetical protein
MRRTFALATVALAACGFDGLGPSPTPSSSEAPPVSPSASAPGAPTSDLDAGTITEVEPPPLLDPAEGGAAVDAAAPYDAGSVFDAGPLPTSPGPPVIYAVSAARFWTLNPTNGAWGGGVLLPNATCPYLDELAVDAFGQVFAIGQSGSRLYRLTGALTCTPIGAGGAGYPQALSFAPRGTLNASDEELVGYLANGDYVRVDTQTGILSLVTAGALAGYVVGDIVNFGAKGYALVSGKSCKVNCLWEVSLTTGIPVTPAPVALPMKNPATALGHWGAKLYAFGAPDEAFAIDLANPAAAKKFAGPPNFVNVLYRGAGSRTIAPTQ